MPSDGLCLLAGHALYKTYRSRAWLTRRSRVVQALRGVSLEIRSGSVIGIVGESGCGKSTLARCLAGLDRPDSGTIELHPELQHAKQKVQLIQQDSVSALNPWFTVEGLISEPLCIAGVASPVMKERVCAAMEATGVPASFLHRRPRELSGGQRQRVAIARTLCVEPKVLILDEFLSGLDLPVQRELMGLLARLQNACGIGCMFISHNLRLVAHCSDEIAVMDEGRIVEQGTPGEILRSAKEACTLRLIDALPRWDRAVSSED